MPGGECFPTAACYLSPSTLPPLNVPEPWAALDQPFRWTQSSLSCAAPQTRPLPQVANYEPSGPGNWRKDQTRLAQTPHRPSTLQPSRPPPPRTPPKRDAVLPKAGQLETRNKPKSSRDRPQGRGTGREGSVATGPKARLPEATGGARIAGAGAAAAAGRTWPSSSHDPRHRACDLTVPTSRPQAVSSSTGQ